MKNKLTDYLKFKKLPAFLFYFSLVFILLFFLKLKIIEVPESININYFIASQILIFGGYLFDSWAWQIIANKESKIVSFWNAFISNGKYIFSKYIPGKIWIIIGKAAYLKNLTNGSLINLSTVSLWQQLISLLAAVFISQFLLLGFFPMNLFFPLLAFCLFILAVILFRNRLTLFASFLFSKIFKKEIILPNLPIDIIFKVFVLTFLNWFLWSAGFYFFLISISDYVSIKFLYGFIFPISAILGIITIISPGGLGVREGVIIFLFLQFGFEKEDAANYSIFSRFWFLLGESLFFLISLFMEKFIKKTKN